MKNSVSFEDPFTSVISIIHSKNLLTNCSDWLGTRKEQDDRIAKGGVGPSTNDYSALRSELTG